VYVQLVRQHEHVFAAFRALDKHGNGYIDAEEARAILQGESDAKITQLMAEFDKNCDGKINYEVRAQQPSRLQCHLPQINSSLLQEFALMLAPQSTLHHVQMPTR
jgi:hypothetical protein